MSAFSPPGGRQPRHRLVGFGLALVVLGWVLLLADLLLSDALLKAGSLVAVLSLKGDIATLAQTLVLTGLGLSLLGGLREGFGALSRFFDAVLQRSSTPRPGPMPDDDPDLEPERVVTVPHGADRMGGERLMPERAAAAASRDRNYSILPDGSVEVDTLLGTRIFASMDEARDFIR